jgi:hypothetical protein
MHILRNTRGTVNQGATSINLTRQQSISPDEVPWGIGSEDKVNQFLAALRVAIVFGF